MITRPHLPGHRLIDARQYIHSIILRCNHRPLCRGTWTIDNIIDISECNNQQTGWGDRANAIDWLDVVAPRSATEEVASAELYAPWTSTALPAPHDSYRNGIRALTQVAFFTHILHVAVSGSYCTTATEKRTFSSTKNTRRVGGSCIFRRSSVIIRHTRVVPFVIYTGLKFNKLIDENSWYY